MPTWLIIFILVLIVTVVMLIRFRSNIKTRYDVDYIGFIVVRRYGDKIIFAHCHTDIEVEAYLVACKNLNCDITCVFKIKRKS